MKLTIITINYNNERGLQRTMQSVVRQTCKDFEYVLVDGGSIDESVDVIKNEGEKVGNFKWVSEKDKGIYNAMNKGIRMASGEYVQFLNSGDCLVDEYVVDRMLKSLKVKENPSILYGNMLKDGKNGVVRDRCFAGQEISFLGLYEGTLNHSPAYIKRELFEKYGLYDERYRIVSDWKWYMKAIVFGDEKPIYVDVDVTLFDMTGISETNKELDKTERRQVLEELMPKSVLMDYDRYAFNIEQMKRLKRHRWAYGCVWFLERVLFKFEKCGRMWRKESQFN